MNDELNDRGQAGLQKDPELLTSQALIFVHFRAGETVERYNENEDYIIRSIKCGKNDCREDSFREIGHSFL